MRSKTSAVFSALAVLGCAESVGPAGGRDGAPLIGGGTRTASIYSCNGVVADGTYENIKVSGETTCTLNGVTVTGNVIALQNARLFVENSRVDGNIQGENASLVHVRTTRIGGSLQIHEGVSLNETGVSITAGTILTQGNIQVTKMRTGRILISDVVLEKGNIQVEENEVSQSLDILNNRVAQNLEVRKHYTSAPKLVSNNDVSQKLECKENDAPFAQANNRAGDFECPAN